MSAAIYYWHGYIGEPINWAPLNVNERRRKLISRSLENKRHGGAYLRARAGT